MNPRFLLAVFLFLFFISSGNASAVEKQPQIHSHALSDLVKDGEVLLLTVPIIALDREGRHKTFANALLIDMKKGLFLANAHIAASGTLFEIITKGETCGAHTRSDWIDWKRDLALFRAMSCKGLAYMENARFASRDARLLQEIAVLGYTSEKFTQNKIEKIIPNRIQGVIQDTQTGWGITLASMVDVMDLRIRILEKRAVENEELHLLFGEYLLAEAYAKEREFKKGLSGSPALSEANEVIGIISGAVARKALIIPARSIRQFLFRVSVE